MMKIVINIGRIVLEIIYCIIKLFPAKKQVVFISRQSDKPSLDIELLKECLENEGISTAIACKTLNGGMFEHLKYCFHMVKQMYLIATSKVVVLDSYCIVASLLHHKKGTKIIQMWHALGSLKKFGYSILDKDEGSKKELADMMRMHRNYDYIIASSDASGKCFAEAFNYNVDRVKVLSLPRVDALLDRERSERAAGEIYKKYPQLKDKENIIYAPTFRKNVDISNHIEDLIEAMDSSKHNLVIKMHPLSDYKIRSRDGVIVDKSFSTLDMLSVANHVITDYSAITYEAALKGKPLYLYAFDIDTYETGRSFYLDYKNDMPGIVSGDAKEIMRSISTCDYDLQSIMKFAKNYVTNTEECTKKIASVIVECLV